MQIQWYPGHMTKTRRMMEDSLRQVDVVAELLDARIPRSSRNPDFDSLLAGKPRVIILNRADQAQPEITRLWENYWREQGAVTLTCDANSGKGTQQFSAAVRRALQDKLQKWLEKGLVGRPIRAMVVGVPNVGKSTFINKIARRKSAKAQNRPGVTRGKQWVTVDAGLELLDTPGILWPKFEDETTGLHLAFTGAVRDQVMDTETLAGQLAQHLARVSPQALTARYGVSPLPEESGEALLQQLGKKRGFLRAGGVVDTERMSAVLLEEFRNGKLGRITLESPAAPPENPPSGGGDP